MPLPDHGWITIAGGKDSPLEDRLVIWTGGGLEGDASEAGNHAYRKKMTFAATGFGRDLSVETIVIRVADVFEFLHPLERQLIKAPKER